MIGTDCGINLWILLDTSSRMRGIQVEAARNILTQYVIQPMSDKAREKGKSLVFHLLAFSNTATILDEGTADEFSFPEWVDCEGVANLHAALTQLRGRVENDRDIVLVVCQNMLTDRHIICETFPSSRVLALHCRTALSMAGPLRLDEYFTFPPRGFDSRVDSLEELMKTMLGFLDEGETLESGQEVIQEDESVEPVTMDDRGEWE